MGKHESLALDRGDTLYVGMLTPDGEYVEVRIASDITGNHLLVTPSTTTGTIVVNGQ